MFYLVSWWRHTSDVYVECLVQHVKCQVVCVELSASSLCVSFLLIQGSLGRSVQTLFPPGFLVLLPSELRAYASSLVHRGCWALEDILQSCCWQSNQLFVNHYLRDLSEQEGGLSRLSQLVAGRQVVNTFK